MNLLTLGYSADSTRESVSCIWPSNSMTFILSPKGLIEATSLHWQVFITPSSIVCLHDNLSVGKIGAEWMAWKSNKKWVYFYGDFFFILWDKMKTEHRLKQKIHLQIQEIGMGLWWGMWWIGVFWYKISNPFLFQWQSVVGYEQCTWFYMFPKCRPEIFFK